MRRQRPWVLLIQAVSGVAVGLAVCFLLFRPAPRLVPVLPRVTPAEQQTTAARFAQTETQPVFASAGVPARAADPWKNPDDTAALSLNFAPYYLPGADPELGTPVSEEAIRNALAAISPFTDTLRTFGVSGELEKLYPVAKNEFGFRVIAGCWIGRGYTDEQIDAELNLLAELGNSGLADMLVVGSECLLRGDCEAEDLLNWMDRVRGMLTRDVPVGVSDTADELIGHPELFDGADVALFTYYPYFNGADVAEGLDDFERTLQRLRNAAGGTPLICSETGWKSEETGYDNMYATPENAALYLEGMIELGQREDIEIIYFSALEEYWKQQKYDDGGWGLLNADLTPRAGFADILNRIADQKE